jgi:hypothetical protein
MKKGDDEKWQEITSEQSQTWSAISTAQETRWATHTVVLNY